MEDVRSEVRDLDEVTKEVRLTISPEKFKSVMNDELANLAKSTKVKGFRPGKAPRQMLEKMYGERVKFEVFHKLISSGLYDCVRLNSIDMVGEPELADMPELDLTKNSDIEVSAKISVLPKPEIKGYDAFTVEVPKSEVAPADIDAEVEKLRMSKSTLRKVELRQNAQKGDVIDASVTVTVEGEEQARPEPIRAQLGDGQLIPELDEGIIGMAVAEQKEIEGSMPADHRNEKLAGKKAKFVVTLNSISERDLPELNDDFVAGLDMGVKSVLELRVDLGKKLEAEATKRVKGDTEVAVLDQLVERNQFAVPQPLIDEEIRALLVRLGFVDPKKMRVDRINVEPFRKQFGDVALKRVRSAILIDRLSELEKLAATEDEIRASVEERAAEHGISAEDLLAAVREGNRLEQWGLELTREKVMKVLIDRTKVSYVEKKAAEKSES